MMLNARQYSVTRSALIMFFAPSLSRELLLPG